jgi:hypothetical protein
MRILLTLCCAVIGFAVAGCESELPSHGPDLGTRVLKGVRGEGALYVPGDPRPMHPAGYSE